MSRRSFSVAAVLALSLVAVSPLAASERDHDQDAARPAVASDDDYSLRPATPNTIQAAIQTLGRVRMHPGRDAMEVEPTAASVTEHVAGNE